jgi:phenylacetate-coenzyme A ligase PaaK-like adenylate-forming protein
LNSEIVLAVREARSELSITEQDSDLRSLRLRIASDAEQPSQPPDVLRFALEHVPFYSSLRATLEDQSLALSDFPILTKRDLANSFPELIARSAEGQLGEGPLFIYRTSGSTGVRCSSLKGPEDAYWSAVLESRISDGFDLEPGTDIWDLGLHAPDQPLLEVDGLAGRITWNLPRFNPEVEDHPALFHAAFTLSSPSLVRGAASRVTDLAKLVLSDGAKIRPHAVLSSYEHLSHAARDLVSAAFQCPVRNLYGTAETGIGGWECDRGLIHFDDDVCSFEVVDGEGGPVTPGETGRLLLTSYRSQAMPIIRYDTGDLASLPIHPCTCDRQRSPAIMRLEGRSSAQLVGPTGERHSPYPVLDALSDAGLTSFQLVQEVPGIVVIVTDAVVDPVAVSAVVSSALSRLRQAELRFEYSTTRPFVVTPAGKRNPVVPLMPDEAHSLQT